MIKGSGLHLQEIGGVIYLYWPGKDIDNGRSFRRFDDIGEAVMYRRDLQSRPVKRTRRWTDLPLPLIHEIHNRNNIPFSR